MRHPTPAADYKNFRLSRINEPQYKHLWLLLFWPVYLLRYILLSFINPVSRCTPVWCPLDDQIPFLEGFVLFYVLWYVFIFGMHIYLMFRDVPGFRKYSKFLCIAMSISTLTYLIYPTCQMLRPAEFKNDNILTWIIGIIYSVDANANVCPSEHVIGALAVLAAALNTRSISKPGKVITAILAVLITLSTVFIKQHSAVDILAAVPVCIIAYIFTYGIRRKR